MVSSPVFASSSQHVTTLNESLEKDSNAVYCPIFYFIWDILKEKIVKENKIEFQEPSDFIKFLNNSSYSADNFLKEYFWADIILGYEGFDINNYIKEKNKEKFQEDIKELEQKFKEYDAVGYSAFFKNIFFYFKFYEIEKGIDFFSETGYVKNVPAFGLIEYKTDYDWDISNQINILDFINDDDFIIKINLPDKDVDLILAKIPKKDNFDLMWKDCLGRINNNKLDSFHKGYSIIIPKVEFYRDEDFPGIKGKGLLNKEKQGWFFSAFITQIGFQMNNLGIKDMAGQGNFVLTRNIYLQEKEAKDIKRFIFDKPFLIALRKKGQAEPFFLLWINNI